MSAVSLQINNSLTLPVKGLWGGSPPISPPAPVAAEPPKVPIDEKEQFGLERSDIKASFSYDQDIKQTIITFRSEDTGEIVRQFPPEKILKLLAGFVETSGSKVDKKV